MLQNTEVKCKKKQNTSTHRYIFFLSTVDKLVLSTHFVHKQYEDYRSESQCFV